MPYAPEHDEVPNPLRPGLRAESIPEPCAVVIFGASGDLAHRKLVPALYNLAVGAHLPAAFGIVGVSKSEFTNDAFVKDMREAVGRFSRTSPIDAEIWLGTTLAYVVNTQFRLGYAYGFSPEALRYGQLYFVASSAF